MSEEKRLPFAGYFRHYIWVSKVCTKARTYVFLFLPERNGLIIYDYIAPFVCAAYITAPTAPLKESFPRVNVIKF